MRPAMGPAGRWVCGVRMSARGLRWDPRVGGGVRKPCWLGSPRAAYERKRGPRGGCAGSAGGFVHLMHGMHPPLLQLGLVQLQLGLILVAIYSRRVATRSLVAIGSCPIAIESDSL
jgi:hypothetical protein